MSSFTTRRNLVMGVVAAALLAGGTVTILSVSSEVEDQDHTGDPYTAVQHDFGYIWSPIYYGEPGPVRALDEEGSGWDTTRGVITQSFEGLLNPAFASPKHGAMKSITFTLSGDANKRVTIQAADWDLQRPYISFEVPRADGDYTLTMDVVAADGWKHDRRELTSWSAANKRVD